MKCPKCGYLGFEAVDRCRNCGYEFSLASTTSVPELPMRMANDADEVNPLDDLALLPSSSTPLTTTTEFAADLERVLSGRPARQKTTPSELPLFRRGTDDGEPLITKPSPPRAPLSVRRSTPEVPRLRPTPTRSPMFEMIEAEQESGPARPAAEDREAPASPGARLVAVGIDLLILAVIDALVIYFTVQICGLTFQELTLLPKGPLVAFLIFQNGGYLVAFTVGGQTLGKMAAGIRVVAADDEVPLDLGHSIVRTAVWALLAIPAGLGFVTTLFSADHRGLHDRCAGTRVIRTA